MQSLLNNKKILITREHTQANVFAEQIRQFKGLPVIIPMLKIDTYYNEENELIINSLNQFDWIFFTSVNGVNHFFKQLHNHQLLSQCQFAVVGHKTEEALKDYGYSADFIPSTYNAETMATEFIETFRDVNQVLFVRGNLSRQVLLQEFTKENIQYSKATVYKTSVNYPVQEILHRSLDKGVDIITFTSPSTIKAFVELIDDENLLNQLRLKRCFCIGTTTEQVAINHQFKKTYIPDVFTIEGMIEKMIDVVQMEEN